MKQEFYEGFEAYQVTAVDYGDPECKIHRKILIALDFGEAVTDGRKYFESAEADLFVVGVVKIGDAAISHGLRVHLASGHFDNVDGLE